MFARVLILIGSITVATLQAPADFSGQWTETAPSADMGSGWGSTITITQNASTLIVEHALFSRYDLQPPLKFVYALDGSEARNAVMIGHATQVRVSRASWDGATLRITTAYPATDPSSGKSFTTEVIQRLTLESPTSLALEVTRSAALGGKPTTTRAVYRRAG